MAINVKLADDLVEDARPIAAVEYRSVPKEIEFYFRMALIAEENSNLSFSLVHEILKADAEEANEEYKSVKLPLVGPHENFYCDLKKD